MKLSPEQARNIVWGDTSDWKEVGVRTTDTTRWSILREGVFEHLPTNKFYRLEWSEGATEMQDESPFEYSKEVNAVEVEQKEVVVKQWVVKK